MIKLHVKQEYIHLIYAIILTLVFLSGYVALATIKVSALSSNIPFNPYVAPVKGSPSGSNFVPRSIWRSMFGCDYGPNEAAQGGWVSLYGNPLSTGAIRLPAGTTSVDLQWNVAVYICYSGVNNSGVVRTSRVATNFGVVSSPQPSGRISGLVNGSSVQVPYGVGGTNRWNSSSASFVYTFPSAITTDQSILVSFNAKAINQKSSGAYECVTTLPLRNNRIPTSFSDFGACNTQSNVTLPLRIFVDSTYQHTATLSIMSLSGNTPVATPGPSGCYGVKPGSAFRLNSTVTNTGAGPGPAYYHRISVISGGSNITYSSSYGSVPRSGNQVLWGPAQNPSLAGGASTPSPRYVDYTLNSNTPAGTIVRFEVAFNRTSPTQTTGYAVPRTLCVTSIPNPPPPPPPPPPVPQNPYCNNSPLSIGVGRSFTASATFKSPLTSSMVIGAVTWSISPTATGSNTSGTVTLNTTVPAGGSNTQSQSISINQPGAYTVSWLATTTINNISCSSNVTITVQPPTCSPSFLSVEFKDPIIPKFSVTNSNAVPLPVTISYTVTGSSTNIAGSTGGTVPGSSTASFSLSSPISQLDPGRYGISWTATTLFGNCNVVGDNGGNGNGSTIVIYTTPYVRFYGADIIAGGGVLDPSNPSVGCNVSDPSITRSVLGYVKQDPSNPKAFKGSGAELAIFALGIINGVQPLSTRTNIAHSTLGFANTSTTTTPPTIFGGSFGSSYCSQDYYSQSSNISKAKLSDQLNQPNQPNQYDLSTLSTGAYTVDGTTPPSTTLTLTTGGAGIPNSKEITIYVNGDVRLTGQHFGFKSTNWSSIDEIPSLYIIANGNIYIDSSVKTMDGVYIAQHGSINTCAGGAGNPAGGQLNLYSPPALSSDNQKFMIDKCNTNLTVHGSFISNKVHLLRTLGTVNDGAAGEGPNPSTQAETFIYSPELYLNNNTQLPSTTTGIEIDSMISRPPVF